MKKLLPISALALAGLVGAGGLVTLQGAMVSADPGQDAFVKHDDNVSELVLVDDNENDDSADDTRTRTRSRRSGVSSSLRDDVRDHTRDDVREDLRDDHRDDQRDDQRDDHGDDTRGR